MRSKKTLFLAALALSAQPALAASECTGFMDKLNTCMSEANAYQHGALKLFRMDVCFMNYQFTALAEKTFCHLSKDLGIDVSKLELPATVEKTFGAKTVSVDFSEPTEAFATAAGYKGKAVISIDGTKKSVIYWAGSEEGKTKGFLIEGPARFDDEFDKGYGVYVQWDRTTDEQSVKIRGAQWAEGGSFLSASDLTANAVWGDLTINSATKAVTVEMIKVGDGRGSDTGTQKCYRDRATGTFGGTIDMFTTGSGEALSSTNVDGTTGMNGVTLTDATSTANGTGSTIDMSSNPFEGDTMAETCNGTSTSTLFGVSSTTVNFDATPDDVF